MKNSYLKGALVFDKSIIRVGDYVDITTSSGERDIFRIVSVSNRILDICRLADESVKCVDIDDVLNGDIVMNLFKLKGK